MPEQISELATARERKQIAKALRTSGRTTEAQKFEQGDQVDDGKVRVALYEESQELLRELRRRGRKKMSTGQITVATKESK